MSSEIPQENPEPAAKRPKRFQLKCKNFYLTFPQCSRDKDEVMCSLRTKFGDALEWAVVAHEKHKSGDPHLHLAFACREVQNIGRPDYFDFLTGQHGNYQGMKNKKECLRYITKDGDYVEYGINAKAFTEGKSRVYEEIGKKIMEGATFDDLCQTHLGACLQNKRKIEDFIAYAAVKRQKSCLLPWNNLSTASVEAQPIVTWLNATIKKPFPFRTRNLYISGPPMIGKSRLIQELSKRLMIYTIPPEEDFYDEYRDGEYDLAVLDEFMGHKRISWMNQWLDGQVMTLRKKGSQYLKTKNLPTIVISNRSLQENYRNQNEKNPIFLQALRTRFLEISLTQPFTITFRDEDIQVESTVPEVQQEQVGSTTTDIDHGHGTESLGTTENLVLDTADVFPQLSQ